MKLKKDKITDRPLAGMLWGISLLGTLFLAAVFYITIPRCINALDSSIWYRYASSNKVTSMVFLEECPETQGFWEGLRSIDEVAQAIETRNISQVCGAMYENIDEVCQIAQGDENYCTFLQLKSLTVEDLRTTLAGLAGIDSVVFNVSFYLALLIYSFVVVGVLKLRKVFYIMAGITYVVFAASAFSSGLTDYLITFVLNIWNKISGNELTYTDALIFRDSFMNALKEAMLTVIIFDTVFQAHDSKKQRDKEYEIEFFRQSLSVQRNYLEENVPPNAVYLGRFNLPAKNIYQICGKQIKHWSNCLKRKRINAFYYNIYTRNLSLATEFAETLNQLKYNVEEHDNAYYIELIKSMELLFAEAYKREMFEV